MTQIRLRIAGLYFNEVVTMDGLEPFTVRDVMEQYKRLGGLGTPPGSPDFVKLAYDVQQETDVDPKSGLIPTPSMLTISCKHPDPFVRYKSYTFDPGSKTYTPNAPSDQTIGGKERKGGLYRLQETPLDGGSTIVAWQYYVQAMDGNGVNDSATPVGGPFTRFGEAKLLNAGDLLTWRMVAIRRAPVDPIIAKSYVYSVT